MFFIQNRYPDDFFYIFLSLFSLSLLRTAEITTPRHSFTTFTTAYTTSIYPTPALRLVTWCNNRERHNTRNDTPIILCQPLSTYKYSHCSARKRRKTTHPRSPVIMPHHEQGRTPPSHSPTNFQSRKYPQPQNGVCRRIRHPCAKIFAIDAAVTFDGRYMKQYQFDRCYETAWHGMKDMKILK